MPLLALLFMASADAAPTLVDRIEVRAEAGGGASGATETKESDVGASGAIDVALSMSDRREGLVFDFAAKGAGDTLGYAHGALGAGLLLLPADASSLRFSLAGLGGATTYPVIGSVLLPMVGVESTIAKRFGASSSFDLAASLGGALVFPGGAGDDVNVRTITIVSSDPVGYLAWSRASLSYRLSESFGVGPFVSLNAAHIGVDRVSPGGAVSYSLGNLTAVGGIQVVLAK